jgi:hypothetical protein
MKTLEEMRRVARGQRARPASRLPFVLIGLAVLLGTAWAWSSGNLPAAVSAQLPGHKRGLGAYDGAAAWLMMKPDAARELVEAAEAGDRDSINTLARRCVIAENMRSEVATAVCARWDSGQTHFRANDLSEGELDVIARKAAAYPYIDVQVDQYQRAIRVNVTWLLAK